MIPCCAECNHARGNKPMLQVVEEYREKWATLDGNEYVNFIPTIERVEAMYDRYLALKVYYARKEQEMREAEKKGIPKYLAEELFNRFMKAEPVQM